MLVYQCNQLIGVVFMMDQLQPLYVKNVRNFII